MQKKIKTNADKQFISKTLADIESDIETGTIADMIECFDKTKLLRKGDGFETYVEKYGAIYDKWNNYNFKYFLEQTPGKESVIERTERIFYVCCSRAKNNLIVYYPKPTNSVLEKAKEPFGAENVKKM